MLNVRILLRRARLDVLDPDLSLCCPLQPPATDIFGAIITANHLLLAAPVDSLLQRANHACRW